MEIKSEFLMGGLYYSTLLEKPYTWNELKEQGFLFDDGWRVPTRGELIDLFDNFKESGNGHGLWSSSPYPHYGDYAWTVSSYYGFTNDYCYNTHRVRLVRRVKR